MKKSVSQAERNAEKNKIVSELLRQYQILLLHINTTNKNLVVPGYLLGIPAIRLKIGVDPNGVIEQPQMDTESLQATLFFNQQPFDCVLPWSSIFAITLNDHSGIFWRDDAPETVIRSGEFRLKPVRQMFQVLDGGGRGNGNSGGSQNTPEADCAAVPHLQLVDVDEVDETEI